MSLRCASRFLLLAIVPLAAQEPSTRLEVTVGKSLVIDSPVNIQRVSVATPELAEAVAVNPRELLINGKGAGETTLIMWEQGGRRVVYDLAIRQSNAKVEHVRQQLKKEFPGEDVTLAVEGEAVFLRGTVKDLTAAERAANIAGTLGKVVNLLNVTVPPVEAQVLLKVRFANVDRAAARDLGVNIMSTGALNTPGGITTQQFTPPRITVEGARTDFSVADALNIFLFRRDLDLGATIKALASRRLLEILAEPNVLAINGQQASFVSGGEFPFPTLQGGGAGLGAVTISFREFGVRINFLPLITPRGTIRLKVQPEVSSLDFANGLVFQGFNIPALATRRVTTEVELEDRQSFAIAGLLDNRTIETLNKIPGISDIPLIGKLFQSQSISRNNSELLIVITPELVRPIPKGQPTPQVDFPLPFLQGAPTTAPRTPGLETTGPVPVVTQRQTIPVEQLLQQQHKPIQPAPASGIPPIQLVPVPVTPSQPANPGLTPTSGGAGK
ncbi:MAG: pilus assembly protein N-terminal domain-containing protein [Bryobacteraceae bacterium]